MKRALSIAVITISLGSGCATPGRQAALAFRYETRDVLLGDWGGTFPIAVGASIDVTVHRRKPGKAGSELSLDFGSRYERAPVWFAVSGDTRVLRAVETPDRSRFRITGVAPGIAKVTVESAHARDEVELRISAPDHASIDHWFRTLVLRDRFSSDTAFVKGGTGRFIFRLHDDGGSLLASSAMQPPIGIEPAGAATALPIGDGDVGHASVRFDQAGTIALLPRKGERLVVQVIDPDEVNALELVELHPPRAVQVTADWRDDHWTKPPEIVATAPTPPAPPADWREKSWYGVAVRGVRKGGGSLILLGDVARVESRSPAVCVMEQVEWLGPILGDGITLIRTLAAGSCEIEVMLGSRRERVAIAVEAKAKGD